MKKRGAIEMQFNWIFVLVIGAFILTFFILIVQKQKSISEERLVGKVLRNLDAIITGAKVSIGTASAIEIPKLDIAFTCDRYSINTEDKRLEEALSMATALFAPDTVKGNEIIAWALDWSMPYRVTNFLYMTSPQVRYIFVGNNSLAKEAYSMLPDKTNKENIKESDILFITNKNNYKVKFIFFNKDPSGYGGLISSRFKGMGDEDIRLININSSEMSKGNISFYKKAGNNTILVGTSVYLGKEALIGAIFAEDKTMYDCAMEKAYKRLNVVSEVYYNRTIILNSLMPRCSAEYISAIGDLAGLNSSNSSSPIKAYAESVLDINKRLQENSCPLIY